MPPALHLPIELLHIISDSLDIADLSKWSRSCRAFHATIAPILYLNVKHDPDVMCWACDEGRIGTVRHLLNAGASPNTAFSGSKPRAWMLQGCHETRFWRPPLPVPEELFPQYLRLPAAHRQDERHSVFDRLELLHRQRQRFRSLCRRKLLERQSILFGPVPLSTLHSFEEDFHTVNIYEPNGMARLGLKLEGDVADYWRDPYDAVKTFPDRCYWTPLHIAAARGNLELLSLLLDNGADINAPSRLFCECAIAPKRNVAPLWKPLHTSICFGHPSATKLLLSRGASINVTTPNEGGHEVHRFTALHSACAADLLDAARAIVDGGYQTDVTVRDFEGHSPLDYAFFLGNWAIIDFLLEHGADIKARIGPLSPLGHACFLGYYAEALRLLDLGATFESDISIHGNYPHLIAAVDTPAIPSHRRDNQREFRTELVNRLIQCGLDVNLRAKDGTSALIEAAIFHRPDVVRTLLRAGADVRARDSAGITPLTMASMLLSSRTFVRPEGSILNTFQALLEAMARSPPPAPILCEANEDDSVKAHTADDIDICKSLELICALPFDHEDKLKVVALLLRHDRAVGLAKAKPNILFESLMGTNFGISNLLLERGFTQPSESQFEELIDSFLEDDNSSGIQYLLTRFPCNASLIRSGSCLDQAVDARASKCAQMLIQEGVSVDFRSEEYGESLLRKACIADDVDTARFLLEGGAKPDECLQEYGIATTPSFLAGSAMIDLFLDYGASIHGIPPNPETEEQPLGMLEVAISYGLIRTLPKILAHKRYCAPNAQEIASHWPSLMALADHSRTRTLDLITDKLVREGGFCPDEPFTLDEIDGKQITTTPLHYCAANYESVGRTKLIRRLTYNAANIHKRLVLNATTPTSSSTSQTDVIPRVSYGGTTPLGWAIEFSSISVVRAMLGFGAVVPPPIRGEPVSQCDERGQKSMLEYAQAACRRQKATILSLLFKHHLNPSICDGDGNNMIHMICDNAEISKGSAKSYKPIEFIAIRSALSIIVCLEWGVSYEMENDKGLSALNRILQILHYTGDCASRQKMAEIWRDSLAYFVRDSKPVLEAKVTTPNDSDEESEADNFVDDDDSSDDDPDDDLDDDPDDDPEPYFDELGVELPGDSEDDREDDPEDNLEYGEDMFTFYPVHMPYM
ncbi:hypothetical protein F5Y18DRAFT_400265 [Xylariaceae sp. FL1019]|nr:hypothetical protein F5Y18DRAFT_400265 [Xylariaceae sp. FL1019]